MQATPPEMLLSKSVVVCVEVGVVLVVGEVVLVLVAVVVVVGLVVHACFF